MASATDVHRTCRVCSQPLVRKVFVHHRGATENRRLLLATRSSFWGRRLREAGRVEGGGARREGGVCLWVVVGGVGWGGEWGRGRERG